MEAGEAQFSLVMSQAVSQTRDSEKMWIVPLCCGFTHPSLLSPALHYCYTGLDHGLWKSWEGVAETLGKATLPLANRVTTGRWSDTHSVSSQGACDIE